MSSTIKIDIYLCVILLSDEGTVLDSVFSEDGRRSNFSDQVVTINGKFHEDGQSDGFNDHLQDITQV